MNKFSKHFLAIFLTLAFTIGACSIPGATSTPPPTTPPQPAVIAPATATADVSEILPTETSAPPPAPAATATFSTYPGEPATLVSALKDEIFPSNYGDNFNNNLYERPFQLDNIYRPDADIMDAYLADNTWYYFSTEVVGVNPATKTLDTPFGFEIDYDRDGRGDFLLWATPPFSTAWANTGVAVYADTNRDVGNRIPMLTDAPSTLKSDGYETVLVLNGAGNDPEAAWARQSPTNPNTLQIAIKKTLINKTAFLWWAWTDFDLGKPALFDYNDVYTAQQAGSPYAANPNFPLKALFGMDNTCRAAYGFTPSGTEPGLCGGVQPTNTPKPPIAVPVLPQSPTNTPVTPPPQKPTDTPIPPPACMDIQVTAQVTDGSTWDPSWASGVTLCIGGDCKHPDSNGYAVWYLPAGGFTINASSPSFGISPKQVSGKKGCGEKALFQFVIGPG